MTPQGARIKAGKLLSKYIRAIADEIYESDEENPDSPITKAEFLARDIWERAMSGDKKCRDIVLERIEGKVGTGKNKQPGYNFPTDEKLSETGKSSINDLIDDE